MGALVFLLVVILLLVFLGVLGFGLLAALGTLVLGVLKWLIFLPINYWYVSIPVLLIAFVVWMYRSGAQAD